MLRAGLNEQLTWVYLQGSARKGMWHSKDKGSIHRGVFVQQERTLFMWCDKRHTMIQIHAVQRERAELSRAIYLTQSYLN